MDIENGKILKRMCLLFMIDSISMAGSLRWAAHPRTMSMVLNSANPLEGALL